MEAGEQKAHSQVSEQDRAETRHRQPGDGAPLPALDQAGVQERDINEPGDEGGGLLGVPTPVAAPGRLGPHRAGEDAQGEEDEADSGRLVDKAIHEF